MKGHIVDDEEDPIITVYTTQTKKRIMEYNTDTNEAVFYDIYTGHVKLRTHNIQELAMFIFTRFYEGKRSYCEKFFKSDLDLVKDLYRIAKGIRSFLGHIQDEFEKSDPYEVYINYTTIYYLAHFLDLIYSTNFNGFMFTFNRTGPDRVLYKTIL